MSPSATPRHYSTDDASRVLAVKSNTLRTALYQQHHYFGIRPTKLPNGKWLWPADQVDALARGEVPRAQDVAA
ncbi:monooxygenase [uncultured Thiodictyon sp.]|uniref:monooxygenase n=1 Tax=uncultured Thiodictyon sp. TaxID=1846217 RepID=UPI0025EF77EC|nr:monooxygenase [uncultured Thiodictyon sp.]